MCLNFVRLIETISTILNVPVYGCTFQVRPNSASISCGAFDKAQLTRTEFWTKDVVDYLECLVEEFFSRSNSHLTPPDKDRPQQMFSVGFSHTKGDPPSETADGEEPSLHFKWWYVVRLLQWHQAEGLLLPSLIVDWVLGQLEVLTPKTIREDFGDILSI